MFRALLLITTLMAGQAMFASYANAADIMQWLEEHAVSVTPGRHAAAPADTAQLLTLEKGQHEMYPQPSPDGRWLLSVTWQGKDAWVSRRSSENGDPVNAVTFDARALDSIHWRGDSKVYYLSTRAGGLGLWEKISDGEGMQRRLMRLSGLLTQPLLLNDGSLIATRLKPLRRTASRQTRRSKHDDFNNWEFPGFAAEIVRIDRQGEVRVLADGVNPALSPDGRWIAFAMPSGRSVHLFRMRSDGSELIQITDARSVDVQPSWSRDGKTILFTSNRANSDLRHPDKAGWDIWAIGIDGRHLRQVTFDKAHDGAARMGRDGRIYFHSDRAISREQRAAHGLKSAPRGYHIWTIRLPQG